MRRVNGRTIGLLGLLLAGCGGGGGGGIAIGTLTNLRIEAVHPDATTVNVPSQWTTNADPSVATISRSGTFTGLAVTSTPIDVSASFGDQTFTVSTTLVPSAATLSGRFLSGPFGVASARLRVFGPS
jgi:hypothetical protein